MLPECYLFSLFAVTTAWMWTEKKALVGSMEAEQDCGLLETDTPSRWGYTLRPQIHIITQEQ